MLSQEVVDRYKRPNERMQIDKRFGIAILPIVGGTVHRGDGPEAASGVQSYTSIQNKLTELLDDRSIRGVLLDIDSGGGEAAGIQELASFITKMSAEKPVWAIANTVAASAAYWTAASADRLYAAPGASVGSIGVYVQHVDVSKMLEKKGVVTTFIFAGKHKVDGNMFEALPDEVRANIKEGVDAMWGDFAGYVADRRGLTTETVQGFEAKMFRAEQAKELGLIDGVGTLGEVLSAFATYLNRPQYSEGQLHGETMSATRENLLYGASDISAARTEAHAAGLKDGAAAAAAAANTEFAKSITTLFPDSKRASAFASALGKGASLAVATDVAAMVDDPKPAAEAVPAKSATQADVDALMAANSPNVRGGDDQNALTAKEKRLAEIRGAGSTYGAARGYRAL
jgi:signal peptide peptidase SppA